MTDIVITAANVIAGSNASVVQGTLGATVTAGQVLYKDDTDSHWKLADSNSATVAARTPQGIALNGGSAGQPVRVHLSGDVTIGAALTAGVAYYLSDTPGGICPVADVGTGEYSSIIGIAASTSVLKVNITSSGVAL